jgi:ATP-binding cassette subfamily B protein
MMLKKNTIFVVGKKKKLFRKRWFLPLLQKRNVIINLFNKVLISVQRKGYTKLHWNQNHFVVCYKIKKKGRNDYAISISDPAARKSVFTKEEFLKCWISTKVQGEDTGTALALQPGPEFYEEKDERDKEQAVKGLRFFARYLRPYKSQLWQLVVGMMVGSALQLIFPFLTQAMVDTGIGTSNLSFITLILIAQLALFTTQLGVNFIRSWIVLHMNTRIKSI